MLRRRYIKGASFERELVNLFWKAGWVALRAAGSGASRHPVPDVIAVNDGRIVIVECKTTSKEKLNLRKAVDGLKEFSRKSGAQAYLAVKFAREKPRFYDICDMLVTEQYTITKNTEYLSFEALVGAQQLLSD